MYIQTITFCVITLLPFCLLYLSIRSDRVCKFRIKASEICRDYDIYCIETCRQKKSCFDLKDSLTMRWKVEVPSLDSMLFSFKKLTYENWFPQEYVTKMNEYNNTK